LVFHKKFKFLQKDLHVSPQDLNSDFFYEARNSSVHFQTTLKLVKRKKGEKQTTNSDLIKNTRYEPPHNVIPK
jgi:hypothetical protein